MRVREVKNQSVNWFYLMPVIIFFAVVPLIVYMKIVPIQGIAFDYWRGTKENIDFFSYYKSWWIIISAALALFSIGLCTYFKKIYIKKTWLYIPLSIYALLVILSTALAQYKDIAVLGFPDRCEGMLVLISYLVICIVAMNIVNEEKHLKILILSLFASASIIAFIGICQYFGNDFFRSLTGRLMILPAAYKGMAETLIFNFGAGTIYSTLYNTNNVGSYMAMILPLSLALFVLIENKYLKLAIGAFSLLIFSNALGCNSRAGYMGNIVAIPVLIYMLRKQIKQNWKHVLSLFVCLLLVFGAMDYWGNNKITSNIKRFKTDLAGQSINQNSSSSSAVQGTSLSAMTNSSKTVSGIISGIPIQIEGPILRIMDKDNGILQIVTHGNELMFQDQTNASLVLKKLEIKDNYSFEDPRFVSYTFSIDKNTIHIVKDNYNIHFVMEEGSFIPVDKNGSHLAINSDNAKRSGYVGDFKIDINGRELHLVRNSLSLIIKILDDTLEFYDGDGKPVNLTKNSGNVGYTLNDPRYMSYRFSWDKSAVLNVYNGDTILRFARTQEGFRLINDEGQELSLEPPKSAIPSIPETTPLISDIGITGNEIIIYSPSSELHIQMSDNQLSASDEKGNNLNLEAPGALNRFFIRDNRFEDYIFTRDNNILQVQKGSRVINFTLTSEGVKYLDAKGNPIDIKPVDSWGFKGRELLGSSRGYIWSRTIPMLKQTILLGHGPDTYAIYYPQYDYVGKLRFLGSVNLIVDKPHNMYLQTAVNTGVLSLLALLALWFGYLLWSARLYYKSNFENIYSVAGVGIFFGLIGYMVTGLFNDSLVSVAPVFWGLLGTGMACNFIYSRLQQDTEAKMAA